jgi:hypothetical protein
MNDSKKNHRSLFGLDRQARCLPGVEAADERMNVPYTVVFQHLRHTGA